MSVSVLTPTIEGREHLLVECIQSVQAQTAPPTVHIVIVDADGAGPAVMRNFMLRKADTPLVAFLDDDDLLDPDHLEHLTAAIEATGADLAFSWHRVVGQHAPLVARFNSWGAEARAYMIAGMNVIPVTVLARREAVMAAGAFNEADWAEDFGLWLRMMDNGCKFTCVPRETWTYRFLGANRTWRNR